MFSGLLLLVLALPAILIFAAALVRPAFTQSVENLFLSTNVKNTKLPPVDQKMIMVLGGDKSIEALGEWPWERSVHATLIDKCIYKARAIALDILFVDASSLGGDEGLAAAMARHGSVVLAYAEADSGKSTVFNNELLYKASAGEGFSNGYRDGDGVTRRYRFLMGKSGITAPSFVCAALMAAGYSPDWSFTPSGECKLTVTSPNGGVSGITLDKNYEYTRFPTPSSAFEIYEYADVLSGKISPDVFEDAIVFVGLSATGAADLITTVSGLQTGTQYQLDGMYTVLAGLNPTRIPPLPDALIALALYIICALFVYRLGGRYTFIIPLAMCAAWLLLASLLFTRNVIWLSQLPQLAAIALAFLCAVYCKSINEAKKRSDMFYSLLACLISAVDAKDPITSGHSQRVSQLSGRLAKRMGLPSRTVNNIQLAGLIHDIGKIGIPDSILCKQGPLSKREFDDMREHPKKGGAIMEAVSLQPEILDGVLYHHERPDGRGYPHGVVDMSVTAKIIKVADVFDALNTERQYKKAWPIERTLNMMYAGRGTEFDAATVDALIADIKPDGWQPAEEKRSGGGLSPFVLGKCAEKARAMLDFNVSSEVGEYAGQIEYLCRDSFFGYEWHSAYYAGGFIAQKPALAGAGEDNACFALKLGGGHILYYFLRGFLAMGALVNHGAQPAREVLTKAYGEPVEAGGGFEAWDARTMLAFIKDDNIVYVMKTILEE